MSRFKRKKRNNTIVELQGVHFLLRTDLVNRDTGRNYGKYHIQDPKDPEYGLCYVSQLAYLSKCVHPPNLELIPDDECPRVDQICMPCYIAYQKRKEEFPMIVFTATETVKVNDELYVKCEEAAKMITRAKEEGKNEIRATRPLAEHCGTDVDGSPVYKINGEWFSKVAVPETRGEVRTVQGVERKEFLTQHPSNRFKRIYRTHLILKTTDVEYHAGQQVRIIIEKERS
jgi:hypothetical protein